MYVGSDIWAAATGPMLSDGGMRRRVMSQHVNDLLLNICTLLNIMRVQLPTVNASNVENLPLRMTAWDFYAGTMMEDATKVRSICKFIATEFTAYMDRRNSCLELHK